MELDTKPSLYAGQPISANLTIKTSFHWGVSHNDPTSRYVLRFNVEEMAREWLVSGPKRGDFLAKVRHLIRLKALLSGFFLFQKRTEQLILCQSR